MTSIFKAKAQLEAQVNTLTGQLTESNTKLEAANLKVKELEAKAIGIPQADHDKIVGEKIALETKVKDLENQLVAEKEKTKDFESKVANMAQEKISATGSPMVKVETDNQTNDSSIWKSKDGFCTITTLSKANKG